MDDLQSAPLYQPTGGLLHTKKLAGVEAELLGGRQPGEDLGHRLIDNGTLTHQRTEDGTRRRRGTLKCWGATFSAACCT